VTIPSPVAGGWQLNGSASLVTSTTPSTLQLTAATTDQAGSAFWPTPVPGTGLSATFDTDIGSGTGADGLTFTLANASAASPTALGVDGGGEGFSGISGIAVSMDTYKNAVNPSSNFVGIATGPGPSSDELNYVTTNSSIASLRNTVHQFVVTTSSSGISVTMDGSQVLSYATTLPSSVLVGFTGGTGGYADVHAVENVAITAGTQPPPPPTVTGINPVTGPMGTSVTVSGTNLTGANAVDFGGTAASSFTVNSATTLTATAPAGSGTVDVTVATAGGTSEKSANDQFTYSAGSSPIAIPSPVAGGWQLNGSASLVTSTTPSNLQLTAATADQAGSAFWPTPVAGVGISAAFDASIGSGSGADGLTFTLANASATSSTALGVDGGGEGFSGISGIAVSLDTYQNSVNPSNNFVGIATGPGSTPDELNYVTTNSSIAALRNTVHHFVVTTFSTGLSVTMDGAQVLTYATTLPASVLIGFTGGTGGLTDVHAVENVAITAGTPPPLPTVTGISPTSGPVGTSVAISGTNLTGATAVNFGGMPATAFTVNSSSSVTATAPAGSGTVDVSVATAGGTSNSSAADKFTYTGGSSPPPAPTVTGISPATGSVGTAVTVSGTNLTGATAVDFGSVAASSFAVNTADSVTATAPAGAGTVDVLVTTAGGQSAANAADEFTYSTGSSPQPIPSPVAGGWQLNGTATLVTSPTPANLQLTSATSYEAGSAFWPTPVAGAGISATFQATIGSGSGADGLTLTLADSSQGAPTSLGEDGGGLGFSGINGIAVALDTYQNSVNPSNNFVGIATGPGPSPDELNFVDTDTSIASLRNSVHQFVVTTTANGISVTMDGTQVLNYAITLPPSVYVGFTGGTGGLNDLHAVENVSITAGSPPPPPAVTAVSPSSGVGGTAVTVTGTNLGGATSVNFAGQTASSITADSATSLTAMAPNGSGTVDVTVTTPSGTSPATTGDQFGFTNGPPSQTLVDTYRGNLARSGYYPLQSGLTTANAASLKVHWTDKGSGGYSFAQPIVADNMVFWEDWSGLVHATSLTGTDVWTTNVGTSTPPSSQQCSPTSAGPSGTPTVATVGSTTVLYVPGGNGVFYELNAQTGATIWSTTLASPPNNFEWGSPTLYEGSVYEGIASYGDCPLVQGKLIQMNASTGAIEHTFDAVPSDCTGGGIWGSPTIDTSDGSIYVDTGNPGCGGSAFAPSIVKLNASNLSVISSWSVPVSAQTGGDADFGSTPVLFTATIGGQTLQLVGVVNKNAIFYAFNRADLAAGPVWQSTVATGSGDPSQGSIVSAAWDGSMLYIGGGLTTINGTSCNGNIGALNPATGAFVWRDCESSSMYAGITEVPGVIVEGTLGNTELFLNAATGATLFTYKAAATIPGESTVSNGIVYIPVGNGSLVALGQ
jgi:energy-converting hydrogenase Eha subunit A